MKKWIFLFITVGLLLNCFSASAEEIKNDTWNIWGENIATEDSADYDFTGAFDDETFSPNIEVFLLEDQNVVKGNVFVCSGGGDKTRGNDYEGIPACEFYNSIGYNAYLVNYRVAPYETVDATLDLQRAIRFVKHYGEEYGIGALDKIATMGFSAGAMHCYSQGLAFSGNITPDSIYDEYNCDDVDQENADVTAVIAVYAAGMPHDEKGNAIDVKAPILIPGNLNDENIPAFFFAGASGHVASGFCVDAYQELNDLTLCELHMYGGVNQPFGMGNEYVSADQMASQIEAFLNVRFGYQEQKKD